MVRGRAVFADITNVSRSRVEQAFPLIANDPTAPWNEGNRKQLQRAICRNCTENAMQCKCSIPKDATESSTPADPQRSLRASRLQEATLRPTTAPSSLQPRIPSATNPTTPLELAERLQVAAKICGVDSGAVLDENAEASHSHMASLTRAASSGRTRRSSSQTGLRSTIQSVVPNRVSNIRATRRSSPGPIACTSGVSTATSKSFEPEPRRGLALSHASVEEQLSASMAAMSLAGGVSGGDVVACRRPHIVAVDTAPSAVICGREQMHLTALFEGMRHLPPGTPDEHVDSLLGDLVHDFMQNSHKESQRHLPTPEQLAASLGLSQRESIIEWLVQACNIMRLQDGVLLSTVLMLDRYCASAREPLPMERMHKVLMAVICTVLKTCTVSDDMTMPLRDLLLHLCRRQVELEEIFTMEQKVLQTLNFSGLSAPTPLDFLDAFCMPLLIVGEKIESSTPRCLANFLIQLSMFETQLYYRHPHAVLAAASLYVALCGLHVPSKKALNALVHDVAAICAEMKDAPSRVATCATELHAMWLDFASTQGGKIPCLLHKFSGSRLHTAVILGPPERLDLGACTQERRIDPMQQAVVQTQERRIDPMLGAGAPSVTYDQMRHLLRDQGLTKKQLEAHWNVLALSPADLPQGTNGTASA